MRSILQLVSSYNLRPKLFLSHFVVALVGTLTFAVIYLLEPIFFGGLSGMGQSFAWGGVVLAGFGATVAATLASLFVAGRIVGPVRHMLAATRRISAGHYDERVPIFEQDELGALSESLNAMAAALEEGEKQRREFIVDISHELRTPLSTLQGYMEGLIDGVVEPSEETWGLMYAEAERMRRLVDDLRQLSQAETGRIALDITPTSPREIVERSAESMLPLFVEKSVKLITELPEDIFPVMADGDRVVQVLDNLLRNALRYTPTGEQVTVGVKALDGEVLFRVTDRGAGIAPEHLPHVFERFYRVEKSRSRDNGGSGVGLAISRALVEAMGGRIWAESEGPGKGTSFSFTLPAAPGES